MQAEVTDMTRNIIITGDDFRHVPCGPSYCPCGQTPSTVCTMGLQTLLNGTNQRYGGTQRIQYTRVEKCGHRGAIGRYCIHFHLMRDCPNCLARGNAVEYGHQRGIVVHGTHMATVSENTLYDVRGANVYIEDGNEMFNYIQYNVVICPHSFDGLKQGCTVPGTNNGEADASVNHAAFWSASHSNHMIGNRAVNTFNGVFFQPSEHGVAAGKVCSRYLPLGRVEGNTCHGHGRFGTYFVSSDWPRQISRALESNGFTTTEECAPFDAAGIDRGLPSAIWNNFDYHNVFVGGYAFGDIQFRNHTAVSSNCLVYHKETKNFHDGCSSHHVNSYLADGGALLASGWGTQIFEDSTFAGNFEFETSHHCGAGVTGVLCNPQYIFKNPTWKVTSSKWINWNVNNDGYSYGGIYNLAPSDAANPKGIFFPVGFQGACNGVHTYLLALDGACVTSASLELDSQFAGGILCKKPLRRLDVYTQVMSKERNN